MNPQSGALLARLPDRTSQKRSGTTDKLQHEPSVIDSPEGADRHCAVRSRERCRCRGGTRMSCVRFTGRTTLN